MPAFSPIRLEHLTPAIVQRWLTPKIERRRFHDLRHSAASLLLAAGVELAEVSMLLGHSELRATMECARAGDDGEAQDGEEAVRLLQPGITQSLRWNSGSDGPLMVTTLAFIRDRLLILPDRKGAGESMFATLRTRGSIGFFRFFDG